jgi:hypothetical protein
MNEDVAVIERRPAKVTGDDVWAKAEQGCNFQYLCSEYVLVAKVIKQKNSETSY